MDPCAGFGNGAVDVVDCDGNVCSEFDVCSMLLTNSAIEGWDHKAVTALDWTMCPQAATNPYKYKDETEASAYWDQCRYFMNE